MPGSFPQGKDWSAQTLKRIGAIKTALDIGPGVGTYAELFQMFEFPLETFDAVEVWEPYVEPYMLESKYSHVYVKDVREWENFDYDLVIFGDVLEHMTKEDAQAVWEKVSKQARYALISIPIVPLPQEDVGGNPYEAHLKDDWTASEVLESFSHIARYRVYSALGVFIADFSYDGEPEEDADLEMLFAENKDKYGGTEIMVRRFREDILPDLPKFKNYRCLVIPGGIPSVEALFDGTPTIIWLHITPSQMSEEAANVLRSTLFQKHVILIIVVSEWHKACIVADLGWDPDKIVVIQNAVDYIPNDPDRFKDVDKVQLFHGSSEDRAMEILIPAAHRIALDFELKIFNNFNPDTAPIEKNIESIVLDERFTYYNKTPHRTVLRYLAQSHIHAYPAVWQETACLTQIEAMVAGCLTVVSDRAVLPETTMGHGVIVPFTGDRDQDISLYADQLANTIKVIKSGAWDPRNQTEQAYDFFSWERARERWTDLHERI